MNNNDPIKVGDLLYAIGPGHHAPHDATDLRVYSAVVKSVRPEGSYSTSAPPELIASAVLVIELSDDRPILGFPKWAYRSHDVGTNVHRSADSALRAFAEQARRRQDEADRARVHAAHAVNWATDQIALMSAGNAE